EFRRVLFRSTSEEPPAFRRGRNRTPAEQDRGRRFAARLPADRPAGGPESDAGAARLHDDDMQQMWNESQGPPAAVATNLQVFLLQPGGGPRPERREDDPRHGWSQPC